jgi:uncharacterized protein YkwD
MKLTFMKSILVILISLFLFEAKAQTKLDSLVFKKINEYRVSNHVSPLIWDESLWSAANNHSTYLVELNKLDKDTFTITHFQNNDSFKTPDKRASFFLKREIHVSECTNMCGFGFGKYATLEYAANAVLDTWKKSKKHNAALLSKKITKGTISCSKSNFSLYKGALGGCNVFESY